MAYFRFTLCLSVNKGLSKRTVTEVAENLVSKLRLAPARFDVKMKRKTFFSGFN